MFSSIPAPGRYTTFKDSSNPVGSAGHATGGVPHERAHRWGQGGAAGSRGRRAMRDLLRPHGLQYRTAASVACRESAEVSIEVPLDLTLGLGHEPKAGSIPEQCGGGADGEGSGVPERIEETRPRSELLQARLTPPAMIGFGARRSHQHVACRGGAGAAGLAVTEGPGRSPPRAGRAP